MAENKKSFIAYVDWKETFDVLPDELAGKLIKHLFAYVNDENPDTQDVLINAVFANIKHTLKRDLRKYETIRKKRADAGRVSGKVRKQKGTKRTSVQRVKQTGTKRTDSVNVSDNDIIKKNIKNKFIPPTLEEVKQFFFEKGYTEESAEKAYNHYSLANWKDTNGKQVLSWKQKMNTVWFTPQNKRQTSTFTTNKGEII